jgi:hypothetical protein
MNGPTPRRSDIPIRATTVGGTLNDGIPPSGADPNAFPPHTEYYKPYNSGFEYMREETGPRYSWKGVEHYARTTLQPDVPVHHAGWNDYTKSSSTDAWWSFYGLPPDSVYYGDQGNSISGVGQLGQMDYPILDLPLLYEESGLVRSVLPEVSMKGYIDAALASMMPSIRGGFSGLNDAIELKDLKSLPRTKKSVEALGERLGLFLADKSRWGRKPLYRLARDAAKGAADVILQFKFNVWPTLNDLAKGQASLKRIDAQLKKLVHDADRPIHRRYIRGITENMGHGTKDVYNIMNSDNPYYCGGTHYQRLTNVGLSLFCATMDYSYKLPSMTSQELRTLALADYFGLQLNPAIIWNAIPWSFVVDWTIGVGQWLDQFSINNIRPVVFIRRFCASVHVERQIRTYLTPNWNSIHEGGSALCSEVIERAYKRVAHYPDLYSSIVSSGISPSEFILASSLAATRLR